MECGGGPEGRIFSGEARADGVSGLSEGGVSRRIKSSDDFGTHPQEGLDRQYNLGPSGEILIGEEINGQGESDHDPERFPDGLMAGVVASECPPLCSRARVWDTVTVASRLMISLETVWTSVSMQFAVPFSRAIKNMDVGEQYVFGPWASLWR
jgi:hypothetical protein